MIKPTRGVNLLDLDNSHWTEHLSALLLRNQLGKKALNDISEDSVVHLRDARCHVLALLFRSHTARLFWYLADCFHFSLGSRFLSRSLTMFHTSPQNLDSSFHHFVVALFVTLDDATMVLGADLPLHLQLRCVSLRPKMLASRNPSVMLMHYVKIPKLDGRSLGISEPGADVDEGY